MIKKEEQNIIVDQNNLKGIKEEEKKKELSAEEEEAELEKEKLKKLLVGSGKSVGVFQLYYTCADTTDKLMMFIGTIGSLGSGISMPLFALLFGNALGAFGDQNSAITIKNAIGNMVFQFLIVGVAMFVSYFLHGLCWTWSGMRMIHKIKEDYFKIILKQEQGWFDKNNAFEFSTKVQSQITQIEGGMGDKLGNVMMSLSMFVTGIIIGLITSWQITLVMIACLPLMVIGVMIATTFLRQGARVARKAYEKAGGIAEEVLYTIKTVSSFANYDFEQSRYNLKVEEAKFHGVENGKKTGYGMSAIFFVLYGMYALAIWYGASLIDKNTINGNGTVINGGNVLTVLFSIIMAAVSLGSCAPNLKALSEATVAASDYFELKERISELDESGTAKPHKEDIKGHIIFNDVVFSYPSKPELKILKGINIVFEPGTSTALVGESGSGKSTIVNLVERLYQADSGSIILDGMDIKSLDIQYLRSLIGYVQQEPVLFNTTIRENVIFGRTNINDTMIWNALDKAYASEFVKEKGGLDYLVGIKGSKLSGGQKQRIAIARAILTEPKLLILDEATSALDNKSEKEVQKALENVSKGVTTIIVAHRLTTIQNAHKIIAMRMGEIIEVGNHQTLIAKEGYYASLVKSQISNNNDENKRKDSLNYDNNDNDNKIQNKSLHMEDAENKNELIIAKQSNDDKNNEDQNNDNSKTKSKIPQIENARGKLFGYLKDKKALLFAGGISAACSGAIFPTYGILLAMAITALQQVDPTKILPDCSFLALMFVVLAVVAGLAQFFQNFAFGAIGETICEKLRKATFTKYLRVEMGYFDLPENSPGSLLTKLSSDTTQLNGVVLSMVGVLIQSVVCLLSGLILSLFYDWRLTLISLCFMPFIVLAGVLQHKLREGLIKADEKLDTEAGSILSESVINTKTIFSYNMQPTVINMYHNILEPARTKIYKSAIIIGILLGVGQFANFATYATVLYAGGNFITDPNATTRISFDSMIRSIFSILFSAFGLSQAQQYMGDVGKAQMAIQSLFSVLEYQSQIDSFDDSNKNKQPANNIKGTIEFRNVTFAYPTKKDLMILKGVSFTIEQGDDVAFVGFSGSGKSTIVQLIERFYDVTSGEILIDGIDIKQYNLYELRKQIGIVSQEPTLFKQTVKENIRYGNLSASDDAVAIAAKNANIGYLFEGADAGTKDSPMSGGEKQRVAIARLLLKDPKVVLLDEATSALDADTEKQVQQTIELLMKGRTSISIAHRLSTIEHCNKIFVVESGVIVEQGNHQELMQSKGKYYGLHRSQKH